MWQAVKNCVSFAGIELEEAIRMASSYPAAVINRQHEMGYIRPGYKANMIIFDRDLELVQTV
jgi:N-acetylglucosamine-6-phosphate deacetylase